MLLIRALPSYLCFKGMFQGRQRAAGSILQATNLTFIVVVAQLASATGDLDAATSAALVAAGVLSVLIYPPIAVGLMPAGEELDPDWDEPVDS